MAGMILRKQLFFIGVCPLNKKSSQRKGPLDIN